MSNINLGQNTSQSSETSTTESNDLNDASSQSTTGANGTAFNAQINATGSDAARANAAETNAAENNSAESKPPETNSAANNSAANNSAQAQGTTGETPVLQNGQSTVSMSAKGKRIGSIAVLPGESAENYYQGLVSTIEELGAKTLMQTFLAEKILMCQWSIKRYEVQKRACLIAEMVKALEDDYLKTKDDRRAFTTHLEAGVWDTPAMEQRLKSKGFTPQSLTQRAFEGCMDEVIRYEQLIAVAMQSMMGFQKSYEALVNRSVMQERLKLQNELLKRDLQAIDVTMVTGRDCQSESQSARGSDSGISDARMSGTGMRGTDMKNTGGSDVKASNGMATHGKASNSIASNSIASNSKANKSKANNLNAGDAGAADIEVSEVEPKVLRQTKSSQKVVTPQGSKPQADEVQPDKPQLNQASHVAHTGQAVNRNRQNTGQDNLQDDPAGHF